MQFDVVKVGLDVKAFAELQKKIIEDNNRNFEANKATYAKDIAINVFGCRDNCDTEENQAIEYLLQKIRKDKGENKLNTILSIGAKIALTYFGIPVPN